MNLVQYSNTHFEYNNSSLGLFEYKNHTRFQNKIQKRGQLNLYDLCSREDIHRQLELIKNTIPNISYYSNINNISEGIEITYEDKTFSLYGKFIDIYSFISNNSTLELLDRIKKLSENISVADYNKLFIPHSHTSNIPGDCPICIEPFQKNDSLVTTQCNHHFHNNCLKTWLTQSSINNNCPSCRHVIYNNSI